MIDRTEITSNSIFKFRLQNEFVNVIGFDAHSMITEYVQSDDDIINYTMIGSAQVVIKVDVNDDESIEGSYKYSGHYKEKDNVVITNPIVITLTTK